jgi:hypothetical protein
VGERLDLRRFRQPSYRRMNHAQRVVQGHHIKPTTKLAIDTISGFEFWFGTKDEEYMFARSREGG